MDLYPFISVPGWALITLLVLALLLDFLAYRRISKRLKHLENEAFVAADVENEEVDESGESGATDLILEELASDIDDLEAVTSDLLKRMVRIEKTYVRRKTGPKKKSK